MVERTRCVVVVGGGAVCRREALRRWWCSSHGGGGGERWSEEAWEGEVVQQQQGVRVHYAGRGRGGSVRAPDVHSRGGIPVAARGRGCGVSGGE